MLWRPSAFPSRSGILLDAGPGGGGGEAYVRTYRAVVKILVGKFAFAARGPSAFEDLDEADAIDGMQRVAALRGGEGVVDGGDVARLLGLSRGLFSGRKTGT